MSKTSFIVISISSPTNKNFKWGSKGTSFNQRLRQKTNPPAINAFRFGRGPVFFH